jgi:hypothetical protein
VIGGMIVDLGDKTVDLSVQSRVTKFNNALQRMFVRPEYSHSFTFFLYRIDLNALLAVYTVYTP